MALTRVSGGPSQRASGIMDLRLEQEIIARLTALEEVVGKIPQFRYGEVTGVTSAGGVLEIAYASAFPVKTLAVVAVAREWSGGVSEASLTEVQVKTAKGFQAFFNAPAKNVGVSYIAIGE